MASRGRRKSVGVVEMSRDLGVSTATASRGLNRSPSVVPGMELAGLDPARMTLRRVAPASENGGARRAARRGLHRPARRGQAVTGARASSPQPPYRQSPRSHQ
jgi:hypothetical protein